MAEYKVKVKNSAGWRDIDNGLISISQGQECHEGDKLDALLDWSIAQHKRCVLNISDTLHRHNLIHQGMTAEDALRESYRLGNAWIRRNGHVLDKYASRLHRVHRWSDWLYHRDFPALHDAVRALYADENQKFRAAAHQDVQGFIRRKEATDAPATDALFKASLDYLLEETAAYIIISRTYRANRIYPAKPPRVFEYLHSTPDVPDCMRGMEQALSVHVSFRRMNESGPQAPERIDAESVTAPSRAATGQTDEKRRAA